MSAPAPMANEPAKKSAAAKFRRDIDYWVRYFDYIVNGTHHPIFNRFVGTEGYPPIAVLLFAINLWVVWHGPNFWRGVAPIAGFVVIAIIARLGAPWFAKKRWLLYWLAALLVLSWGVVWYFGGDAREADGGLYHHVLAPTIAIASLVAAIGGTIVARSMVDWYRGEFQKWQTHDDPKNPHVPKLTQTYASFAELLPNAELFFIPVKHQPTVTGLLASALPTLRHYGLPILWACSVYIILARHKELFYWVGIAAIGVILCALGNLIGARFRDLFDRVYVFLFDGAPLAVSLGVIVLAITRLLDIQYVSTLLNSTPSSFIILLLFAAYACLWQYELWICQALCERLLGLLKTPMDTNPTARVRYDFTKQGEDPAYTTATLAGDRHVQIHGGRLTVAGKYFDKSSGQNRDCWESYSPLSFFDTLVVRAFRRIDPSRKEALLRYRFGLEFLVLGINSYLIGLTLLLVGGFGAAGHYCMNFLEPEPAIQLDFQEAAVADKNKNYVADSLFEPDRKRIIMVAASGGGSRAALYTGSVLHGLWSIGAIKDVKICSGVSGGGAGLAYFAIHHEALCNDKNGAEWLKSYDALGAPFIEDVVQGAVEMRIVGPKQTGLLLSESFDRHMKVKDSKTVTLGSAPLGLIFNTTLCGESDWQNGRWAPANAEDAGGRVVFTNLHPRLLFPQPKRRDPQTLAYRYEVINNPEVRLTQAAAANANFPPVFSNLGVAIKEKRLYWVSDGGTADNRGVESLLLALKTTLAEEVEHDKGKRRKPAPLHLVVAEASGFDIDYKHDRGWGAKMNSAGQITNQLIFELLKDVRDLYKTLGAEPTDVRFHYLAMPRVYCTRGGIGTHWMLPSATRLSDPDEPNAGLAKSARINRQEILELMKELHPANDAAPRLALSTDADKVRAWVQKDSHGSRWVALRKALAP